MDEQLKSNISSSASWIRLLFMIFFAICLQVASFVMGAVVIVQFLFVLIGGERNEELRRFGASLAEYFFASLKYLTYNSDEKPFPFAEWPDAQEGEDSLGGSSFSVPDKTPVDTESSVRANASASEATKTRHAQTKASSQTSKAEAPIAPGEVDPLVPKEPVDPELTAEVVEEIKHADEHDMEEQQHSDAAAGKTASESKPPRKRAKKPADSSSKKDTKSAGQSADVDEQDAKQSSGESTTEKS